MLWVIIFFVRISNGVTHFSRISGQDVTTFFLAIPWVKCTSLEIPEGVFKKTRLQPLCLSFFLSGISLSKVSLTQTRSTWGIRGVSNRRTW